MTDKHGNIHPHLNPLPSRERLGREIPLPSRERGSVIQERTEKGG